MGNTSGFFLSKSIIKKKGFPEPAKAFTFDAKFKHMQQAKILIVDNYDSFTYNLVNVLRKGKQHNFVVKQNDAFDLKFVADFDKIIFSPGPDVPGRDDMMWKILEKYKSSKSILGVCLGFQSIGLYFGAKLFNLQKVYHGQKREIEIIDPSEPLFQNIKSPFTGGLYHSWGISWDDFPKELIVTAQSNENRIMAIRHRSYDVRGVQFHPESIMTPEGEKMILNWVNQ